MKTIESQNRYRSSLIFLAASLLFWSCSENKVAPPNTNVPTKESAAESGQLTAEASTETPHAPLSQQKQCADQAKRAFDESYTSVKGGMNYDFTSHFDAKNNICYILVHSGGVSYGSATDGALVFDAYEGRTYASYVWVNTKNQKFWEVKPTECSVKPRNGEEIICHSSDEFDSLVDKYFGIGR